MRDHDVTALTPASWNAPGKLAASVALARPDPRSAR